MVREAAARCARARAHHRACTRRVACKSLARAGARAQRRRPPPLLSHAPRPAPAVTYAPPPGPAWPDLQGYCKCENCRGTGFRAAWLGRIGGNGPSSLGLHP